MKLTTIFLALTLSSTLALAQQDEVPKNIADSIGGSLRWTEGQFLTAAEAMPEAKYSFIPSAGEFKGVRSFAEQVKHVACANFAFFNEIEGKTPSPGLRKGRPRSRQNQGETGEVFTGFLRLRSPRTRHHQREERIGMRRGPYAGPNTRLGIAVAAVWHIADRYGQIVEYLRMNGIVPPSTQQYGLVVR